MYWEEHRNDDNKIVGFDIAFEIEIELIHSLPPNAGKGFVEWFPLLGVHADPLDFDLMKVTFTPLPLDSKDSRVIHVYLPKSPFKAEGFELPEFQEAAQSE